MKRITLYISICIGFLIFQSCLSAEILEEDLTNKHFLDPQYDGDNYWQIDELDYFLYASSNRHRLRIYGSVKLNMFPGVGGNIDMHDSFLLTGEVINFDGSPVTIFNTSSREYGPTGFRIELVFDDGNFDDFDLSEHYLRLKVDYLKFRTRTNEIITTKYYDLYYQ